MDTVLELKAKNKLSNAFKIKKSRKQLTNNKSKKLPEDKDMFTFLDKILISDISSSLFLNYIYDDNEC